MKKTVLFLIILIVSMLICQFIFFKIIKNKNDRINNNIIKNDNVYYQIEEETNIDDKKELLRIQHWEDTYIESPEAEVKTINSNYIVDTNKYVETLIKTYENDSKVEELVTIIRNDFNIIISNKWKYYIHYYDKDKKFGTITFIYYINNIIGTNRAIHFIIDDGIIDKISYSHLNEYLNEEELLYSYNYFINHFIQERGVIDRFKNYYTIVKDEFHYNYNFKNKKLKYTYQIFYRYPAGVIDNDWGTEIYIEPKIIVEFIKTYKIIVNDSKSGKVKNTITNKKTIRELTRILSRTLPMGNSEKLVDVINSNWELELYDENDILIDTLYVWNDGKLGFNNSRDEYLKYNYYLELVSIINPK